MSLTSQTPQEKEKFCGCCLDCGICPPKEGHDTFCPLYTPPAQEEKKETCCSGSTECTCLVKQPPQPKEPKTWEENLRKEFLDRFTEKEGHIITWYDDTTPDGIVDWFIEKIIEFIRSARLSAAAEERKRVCEEMKKEIKKLEITEKKGLVEMVFGDKRKEKIRIYSNMDVGYNQAIEDVLSLIESIKNSV